MDFLAIFSFLGTAMLLTIMPGPDNMFVLAQSISQNKQAGFATTLGLCTGLLVHITAAAAGISAIVYQSAFIFHVVKYAGAIYLLYLAFKAFRSHTSNPTIDGKPAETYRALYKKGVIMNVLNPKVSLFFLALLPQFVNNQSSVPLQMIGLGLVFLIQAFFIFSLISIFAAKIGNYLRKNKTIASKLPLAEGTILTLISLNIVFSKQ
ncbi:LysE family translocator [Paenibacillus yanchengensis]|uniref:LysE family translocator n=1 Tax=Paenibacillus yanchengensis TaxID=2035833 RepID=A0ABW4YI70_9BACL